MADSLNRLFTSGPALWTGLGRPQQLLLLVLALLLPAVLFVGGEWLSQGQYVPLFASLATEDAGAIVAQLKASKTPYRIGGNGEQILVPSDRVAETRLRMAMQGLPLGGGVGFEVFDKPAIGSSDFTQRLNYQRALQGELARSIGQIREIQRVRVHLALPQPSLFSERDRPASASVFLKLAPGGQVTRDQVRGIVHLVASSVEGLQPERVTVVDTAGRVLAVGEDSQPGQLSPRRLEIRAAVEEGLQRRVQSLLDSALGPGRAVTRVSAQVSLEQGERTEERYDPTPITRQKTKTVETTKGSSTTPQASAPPPAPAIGAPQPAPPPAVSVTSSEGSRESESVTYEVSRIVARTLTTPGDIQRLSVAVLLNTEVKIAQAADKKEVRAPVPRSPEEIEKIRKIVMGAVGYNQQRGDEVTVVEMPFDTTVAERERALLDQPVPPAAPPEWVARRTLAVAGAVLALAIASAFWLLRGRYRRRALAAVALSLERQVAAGARPGTELAVAMASSTLASRSEPLVSEELLQQGREREDIRHKAVAMASTEPDATAQLLRAWLVKKKSLQPARGGRDAA